MRGLVLMILEWVIGGSDLRLVPWAGLNMSDFSVDSWAGLNMSDFSGLMSDFSGLMSDFSVLIVNWPGLVNFNHFIAAVNPGIVAA
jgi:hypothetical protein